MKTGRKILTVFLSLAMLFSMCAVAEAESIEHVFSNPGTFHATALGKNGDISVTAVISEDSIKTIEYESMETETIGIVAIESLVEEILTNQTLNVDAISGATITSNAFLTAITDIAEQAGGNMDMLLSATVNNAQEINYLTKADVIVVGAGGAGLTAAVSAAEKGASVIVLEKSSFVGGNTEAAQAGMNALNSQIQKDAGVTFSREEFIELQTNDLARPELYTTMIDHSGETVDWLVSLGANLELNPSMDRQVKIPANAGMFTTQDLVNVMKNALDQSGATLYLNMTATSLVTDDNNRVTGVKATDTDGNEITFNGKSIVLATGGFGKNHDLVVSLHPEYEYVTTDEIAPTTGDGIEMAVAVGAITVDLDQLQIHPTVVEGLGMFAGTVAPGGRTVDAIFVNLNGERFMKEDLYGSPSTVIKQPEGKAIMIFDEGAMNDTLRDYLRRGYVVTGSTPSELAEALGINPVALSMTVDKWNEDMAQGVDTLFERETNLNALEGQLYAFKFNPGVHYCMGGILINESAQVVDEDNAPIGGLYAAGEVTGGIHGTKRVDGSAICDTFTFGRIAGKNAANYAVDNVPSEYTQYTPGTYTSSGIGRNANLTLEVSFDESRITDINIIHSETPTIGGMALDILKEEALEHQTSNLDAVSGATLSSFGFRSALANTIKQAGGDPSALEKYTRPVQDFVTEADVLVIGAGGAGLTAALNAYEGGASVIVLEKSGVIGGNFIAAHSGFNAADTDLHTAEGTDAAAYKEKQMNNDLVREELVDALVENSGVAADWVADKGVELKQSERNPLMLEAVGSETTTIPIINAYKAALENTEINLYTDTRATELLQDESGRVIGAKALARDGSEVSFYATKGVILATGGFGQDHERVISYRPDYADTITDETAPTTGDGLDMASAVGAVLVDMGEINMHAHVLPGYGMLHSGYMPGGRQTTGIYVNKEGQRFMAEYFANDNVGILLNETDGDIYMIFDEDGMNDTLRHLEELGIVKAGETPEELAGKLGLNGEALSATISDYNEDVEDGVDDAFNKAAVDVLDGRFYGYRFKVGVHYFMGGVLIDPQAHVVDADGQIIPGLYAAGEVTGGVQGTTRVDGTGIGDSLTFGYIAGHSVLAD